MNVYTCTNFVGHWPVGVAALIVAPTKQIAKIELLERLKRIRLPQTQKTVDQLKLRKINLNCTSVIILGDY